MHFCNGFCSCVFSRLFLLEAFLLKILFAEWWFSNKNFKIPRPWIKFPVPWATQLYANFFKRASKNQKNRKFLFFKKNILFGHLHPPHPPQIVLAICIQRAIIDCHCHEPDNCNVIYPRKFVGGVGGRDDHLIFCQMARKKCSQYLVLQ